MIFALYSGPVYFFQVIYRVEEIADFGHTVNTRQGKGFGKRTAKPHPIFQGVEVVNSYAPPSYRLFHMNKQANNFLVRTHTSKAEARAIPPFAPRRRCLRSRCFSWMFFKKNDTGVMSRHLQAARYTFLPVISYVSECSETRKVSYLVQGMSLS